MAERVQSSSHEQKVASSKPTQSETIIDCVDHSGTFKYPGLRFSELSEGQCWILAHVDLAKDDRMPKSYIANFTRNWILGNVSLSETC